MKLLFEFKADQSHYNEGSDDYTIVFEGQPYTIMYQTLRFSANSLEDAQEKVKDSKGTLSAIEFLSDNSKQFLSAADKKKILELFTKDEIIELCKKRNILP